MAFTKGYDPLRDRLQKRSRYTMSCYSCQYYYQAVGDTEEVCQNSEVLQYDMVIDENSIFCNHWELCHKNTSKKKDSEKPKDNGGRSIFKFKSRS